MPNMTKYQSEDFPKNLSIDIKAKHSFKNFEKITNWYEKELKFYQEIGNPSNISHAFISQIKNQINSKFSQNRNESFEIDNLLEELKNHIETTFKSQGLIASNSKEGKWLLKQHNQNPTLTLGSFTYFQNRIKGVINNNTNQRDGEFSAYLFDNGIEPDFETEKEQYQTFYNEIIEQKDELLKELSDIREENKVLNLTIKKQNTDWENTFTTQKEEIAKKFNDEYERHETTMNESEEFYEKKLAVKNAVTYWSNKAKSHKTNSYIFGIIAGLLMIVSIIGIFNFGKYIIGLDLIDINGIGRKILTKTGALQLWVYGFFIISMTLVIWFIKLLVKVFLSNLHLLSDAKERETMIQTYLAFEREENTLKDTDRDLILPSIFRVSANGYIKDDSSPNSPINIITKKFTE
ncbi:hypothetical protein ES692_07080 [Psychroserpens burtonensis]|uniref:DUF6161 domain-containing protein n=1 Tax=Psychroserpens burtonensis TaxID=49278 RepID=A0A5C7BHN9_9FLAO|nr:DUF6161 domain-containing protein [Psychroserpens burtonensis]TXE18403.1 hypothetical protein ES692_07080 [Psychroserpens burtonensis]